MYDYQIKFCYIDARCINNTIAPKPKRIEQLNNVNGFYRKLKKSIINEGIRNPVVLNAKDNEITTRYGGSRIYIAQDLNIKVPAIIADFDNMFPNALILEALTDMYDLFVDRPAKILPKPYGINVSGCKHIHLDIDDD